MYADAARLLAFGASLSSVSLSKNFFDKLQWAAGKFLLPIWFARLFWLQQDLGAMSPILPNLTGSGVIPEDQPLAERSVDQSLYYPMEV